MYLDKEDEWLVIIVAVALIVGLIVKSYKDYRKMTAEANRKIAQHKKNEAYAKKLKKVVDIANLKIKKDIEAKKKP